MKKLGVLDYEGLRTLLVKDDVVNDIGFVVDGSRDRSVSNLSVDSFEPATMASSKKSMKGKRKLNDGSNVEKKGKRKGNEDDEIKGKRRQRKQSDDGSEVSESSLRRSSRKR